MKLLFLSSLLYSFAVGCVTTEQERQTLEAHTTDNVKMTMDEPDSSKSGKSSAKAAGLNLVVIAENVKAYEKPSVESKEITTLPKWEEVYVTKTQNGWSYIKNTGWVESKSLGE